ncbi:hypothetical protein JMUB7535_26850 [Staphylococcus aureus]
MSRGLGDVYKRQQNKGAFTMNAIQNSISPVSYTHLTLPTILRV